MPIIAISASLTRSRRPNGLAAACNGVCNAVLRLVRPRFSGLVAAINETSAQLERAIGAVNEQIATPAAGSDGASDWIRLAPFGSFPNRVGLQVVDRQAGEAMVTAFNSIATRLATLFRGLPVYEGHPDDPDWRKVNPGVRAVAVGRVKELTLRDDGLWGRVAWNDRGAALVRGEAPAYTAQSPHWGMLPVPGRPKAFRPVEVLSLGLTNTPNIPDTLLGVNEAGSGESSPLMREKLIALLAALGRPVSNPSAVTDEQLVSAVNESIAPATLLVTEAARATTLASELATAKSQVATATNEAATLRTSLEAERGARAELVVTTAVNEGRITQAQRAEWLGKLTANGADFTAVAGQLAAQKKAINTRNGVADVGGRKGESGATGSTIKAINEAVALKQKEGLAYDAAFAAVRTEKPELFKPAAE